MDSFENLHMDKLNSLGVKTWLRYVDDTFVIFNRKEDAELGIAYLNSQHPNIKFTFECENKNCINFLDMVIKRRKDLSFSISTYHKPTFTGVYLN